MEGLSKISIWSAVVILFIFFYIKINVLFGLLPSSPTTRWTELISILLLVPIFGGMAREYVKNAKSIKHERDYRERLSKALINQSHNNLFYEGNTSLGAKELTEIMADSIKCDRSSIWLFEDEAKTLMYCEQLYISHENRWESEMLIDKKDYGPYFKAMEEDRIIVAHDVNKHPATIEINENYLKPLGIQSILGVPILYKGDIIGLISVESLSQRTWTETEIDFAHLLSSLYSFAYSVKETILEQKRTKDLEKFINTATLMSKTDKFGKITYVNKKFEDVSGWRSRELMNKDHNIVNSGAHSSEFWADMYKKTAKEKKIWSAIVTNKAKNGELYYVDTHVKAEFDEWGELMGYMSIRYDVTNVVKGTQELEKKNSYLEHAAKILRHDMHSGINTYMPRGLSALERKLDDETIKRLKLEAPLKLIKEGLQHTQKVYRGVYEFTNLVKKDTVLTKEPLDIKKILKNYLSSTAYVSQVIIEDLIVLSVNESLFCTAIDNLIRNGLKYNDSNTKFVRVYMESGYLIIQDNGRGMTQKDLEILSKPYTRKKNQKEPGTGLGLNICIAILDEHGFELTCEKNEIGTKMKININKD
jgi:PAS domain S-box-containing protein